MSTEVHYHNLDYMFSTHFDCFQKKAHRSGLGIQLTIVQLTSLNRHVFFHCILTISCSNIHMVQSARQVIHTKSILYIK